MFGADTHHPPEHPHNQMTSDTNIRCTVKKPKTALEINGTPHVITMITNHQADSPMKEMNKAMVKGTFEKYEEHEEMNVTPIDRNMQHVEEESKQKLVTNKRQENGLDVADRPKSAFNTNENPHTLLQLPPEEPPKNHDVNDTPSPTSSPIRSLQEQDLTEKSVTSLEDHWYKRVTILENEANHMKKVHKDDSSDSKHLVETVKKEKYEVLDETVEFNNVTTETAAKEGNAKNEQSLLTTTPTEASGGPNTKENRSLEEHKKATNATSDDSNKGITLTKEITKVGRNDEEEYILVDDTYKDIDEDQHRTSPTSSEKYVTAKNPNSTRKCEILINTLHDGMGTAASERHDDIKYVYRSDAEVKNKSTMIEEHYEEPVAETDTTEARRGLSNDIAPHRANHPLQQQIAQPQLCLPRPGHHQPYEYREH